MSDYISRQAAIDALTEWENVCTWDGWTNEHKERIGAVSPTDVVIGLPSEQPEIIRCKDCKYYEIAWLKKDGTDNKRYKPSICVKGQYGITRKPDWFCTYAERREDG